jgi:PKD repeat protein
VASFTATPSSGEAPLGVSFNASGSYDSDGSITSYAWNFGDGSNGTGATASHTYNSAGTYTAQLTVTDNDGGSDFVTQTIQVSPSTSTQHTANCQTGTAYLASDGLTVTLHSCVVVEKSGSYEYTIDYTLTNNTPDQAIDESSFKMYYKNETGGLPQYGFFGKLFPGDTLDRAYTFEELKTKPFDLLEYAHDNFFSLSPLGNSLRWSVDVP